MSITPDAFLKEAHTAAARADEMGQRQAVSRAYYAAYHWALTVSCLCPPLEVATGSGIHELLIERFTVTRGIPGDKIAQAIGSYLDKGRKLRVDADYKLGLTVGRTAARNALFFAGQVKRLVDEFAQLHTA